MSKGGLADSPFFHLPKPPANPAEVPPPPERDAKATPKQPAQRKAASAKPSSPTSKKSPRRTGKKHTQPREHDTTVARDHDTVVSRYHDTLVELIRAAVKQFGKEAATHRFTSEEKKAIADIIYTYKLSGVRTSENEVTRIAVNFLLADYQENGANSILNRVLRALNG